MKRPNVRLSNFKLWVSQGKEKSKQIFDFQLILILMWQWMFHKFFVESVMDIQSLAQNLKYLGF